MFGISPRRTSLLGLAAERRCWEEAAVTFITWNAVEQALKNKIIAVFEPMYLEIINNDRAEFSNQTARDMLEHLFISYDSITAVDLEHKFKTF
jgi:hypothetical protein